MANSSYQFDKISVLIVEDNQPMLNLVKSIMKSFGVEEVYGAANGEKGFELFEKHNPDLVIADWMMSPMDGIDLTKKIRESEGKTNKYVPIILMTGFSQKNRVVEARDAGITEFMVKPFDARDLYKRIVQVIEKPRQFVKADQFFGPDRRRRSDKDFRGRERREENV